MSCSAFVHIEYSKELEDKILKIDGIEKLISYSSEEFVRVRVSPDIFLQHKKEADAHRWIRKDGDMCTHYDPERNPGECGWEYLSHGFEMWLNFEGDIVFVVPCHWDEDHGRFTLVDIREWIKDNLGDIKIKSERVS